MYENYKCFVWPGADINAQTEETQETALTLACCGGFLEVADFLIKAGADIELGASTPLMEASQEGHLELVRYVFKARFIFVGDVEESMNNYHALINSRYDDFKLEDQPMIKPSELFYEPLSQLNKVLVNNVIFRYLFF